MASVDILYIDITRRWNNMGIDHKESGNAILYLQTMEAGFFVVLVAQAHFKHSVKIMGTRHVHVRHVHVHKSFCLVPWQFPFTYRIDRSVFSLFIGTSLLQAPFYGCSFAFVVLAVCREAFKTFPTEPPT